MERRRRRQPKRPKSVTEPQSRARPASNLWWLLGIFVLALAVRLVYLAEVRDEALFRHPVVDAALHAEWAEAIRDGRAEEYIPFYKPPLYPYALAGVQAVAGTSTLPPVVIQMLFSALACVLTYWLAGVVLSEQVARISGVAAALLDTSVFFDGQLLAVSPLILCLLTMLCLTIKADQTGRRWLWLLVGLFAGIGGLLWPATLVGVPALVAWAWLRLRREGVRPARLAGVLAMLLIGAAAPLMPAAIVNHRAGGPPLSISANGGINFYIGNGPEADGYSAVPVGLQWEAMQLREERLGLEPFEGSSYWFSQAFQHIAEHPGQWLGLMAKKAALFWQGYDIPNNISPDFMRRDAAILRLLPARFGVIAPFALVGMVLALRERRPGVFLLFLYMSCQFLAVIAFFVCARYRMGVVFVLIPFAAFTVVKLASAAQARKWPLGLYGALGLLLIGMNVDWLGVRSSANYALDYINLGNVQLAEGNPQAALRAFRLAANEDRDNPDAHLLMGAVLRSSGQLDQALPEFQRAAYLAPDAVHVWSSLGSAYLEAAQPHEAAKAFSRAVDLRPTDTGARTLLAAAYRQTGDFKHAAEQLEAILRQSPDDALSCVNLARVLLEGRLDTPRALELARRAHAQLPDSPPALDTLGWALLGSGQPEEAIVHLRHALQLGESADALFHLAQALEACGDVGEARKAYADILRRWSQTPYSPLAEEALQKLGASE